jgi:Eco57I restriction-modification methylase
MRFDVICGNPPYSKKSYIGGIVPTRMGLNGLAADAAKTELYAAFTVKCVEQLKANGGQVALVFPNKCMQVDKFGPFREWLGKTNVNIVHNMNVDEWDNGTEVNTIICVWLNGINTILQGSMVDEPHQIKLTGKIVPYCPSYMAEGILNKVLAYPYRIQFDTKVSTIQWSLYIANALSPVIGGTGPTKDVSRIAIMSPLRPNEDRFTIHLNSREERDTYLKWWYEPLPSFIVSMFDLNFNSSYENTGQLPDILKILNGRPYDRQLIYNELGITEDEVKYLEAKVYDLAKIDGIENIERAKQDSRRDKWALPE